MKSETIYRKLLLILLIAIALNGHAQEFTLTTSAANIISAKALIDLPGLTGNPDAIIVATPLGNTKASNPNPIGAWYYSGKWNIFNSNFAPMVAGLTYKVQYFVTPGTNQFLHLVTQQSLGSEGTYIDNPALNNKPNVQFTFLQNHSPDVRQGSWLNKFEEKAGYSTAAAKWYITNIGGQAMQKGSAYNIVINTGGTGLPPNPADSSCNCPASLPPNGMAGGDLGGTYPNPTLKKIGGFPVSTIAPQIGQVLKWNGTEWAPAPDDTGTPVTSTAATGIKVYEYYLSAKFLMNNNGTTYDLPGLDKTINIPTASTVIVTMTANGENFGCLACGAGSFFMALYMDDMYVYNEILGNWIRSNNHDSFLVPSSLKAISVGSGNHRFKITAQKSLGGDINLWENQQGQGTKMTIIVIPQ